MAKQISRGREPDLITQLINTKKELLASIESIDRLLALLVGSQLGTQSRLNDDDDDPYAG